MGGRQIFDNAIVRFECMQKVSDSSYFCLKLDMSKAYDQVKGVCSLYDAKTLVFARLGKEDYELC